MPLYKYRARSEDGKKLEGMLPAQSKSELAHTLKKDGLLLVYAIPTETDSTKKWGGIAVWKRVPLTEKMMFIKHLAIMIRAGLSIPRALNILSMQTSSKYFKEVINNIGEELKKGKSLADGLALYPKIFPPMFSSTIRIGEVGGNLDEVLELLAIQLEKEHEIRSKVKGALIYPSVIVVAMIIVGIIIMIFVVPNLMKIFTEMNVQLPLSTRMIIGMSTFLKNNMIATGLVILLGPIGFYYFRKSKKGKKIIDYIVLHLPTFGGIVKKVNTARFSRGLSSLLKSGVSIVQALDIISDTLGNTFFKEALVKSAASVQKGIPLNQALGESHGLFPEMVTQMIKVGEETGSSEQILFQLADFYEKEVDEITKNLSAIIEPVLLMVIGTAVGFFAISIIQPMYSIMDYM